MDPREGRHARSRFPLSLHVNEHVARNVRSRSNLLCRLLRTTWDQATHSISGITAAVRLPLYATPESLQPVPCHFASPRALPSVQLCIRPLDANRNARPAGCCMPVTYPLLRWPFGFDACVPQAMTAAGALQAYIASKKRHLAANLARPS